MNIKTKRDAEVASALFNAGLGKPNNIAAFACENEGHHGVGVETVRDGFEFYTTIEDLAERLKKSLNVEPDEKYQWIRRI